MDKYYRVQADIDLSAIKKNIETMHACIPEGKKLLAVIKANAYGLAFGFLSFRFWVLAF